MVTMKAPITASCCAISDKPVEAHLPSLQGEYPDILTCSTCEKPYTLEYNPYEFLNIPKAERRFVDAAQSAINESHPRHPDHISVTEI